MKPTGSETSLKTSPALPEAKPKFLDQLRHAIRLRHYSIRTEEAYVQWARRFILYPQEMGRPAIEAFLTHLAVEGWVAASTQRHRVSLS